MLLNPLQSRMLIADALGRHYAVLAVNADSPAAITDCLEAARAADSPVIIETSLWQLTGHSFGAGDPIRGLLRYIAQTAALANDGPYASVPVVFHTDHIKGPQTLAILTAAAVGMPLNFDGHSLSLTASTISLDSSELSEAQNIDLIGRLASAAAKAGRPITLEMEAGVDDGLTPPDVARRLLAGAEAVASGLVWLWAPGLGTQHGFSDAAFPFSPDHALKNRELARQITGRDLGIALHGSSGLSQQQLKDAVAAGVAKVNWSSESLLLRSTAAAEFFNTSAEKLHKKHKEFKPTAMDNGVQAYVSSKYVPVVADRMAVLGSAGMASGFMATLLG